MSSRVHIAVDMVALPSLRSVCALPSHTSVPCESPAILTRSEKYCGLVSIIKDGRIVRHETVDELKAQEGKSVDEVFREEFRMGEAR